MLYFDKSKYQTFDIQQQKTFMEQKKLTGKSTRLRRT